MSDRTPGYRLGSSRALVGGPSDSPTSSLSRRPTESPLGKRLLGHRVVRLDGTRLGWGGALLRNVLRPIDYTPLPVIATVSICSSDRRQRLGDRLAGTAVVRIGRRERDKGLSNILEFRP